VTDKESEAVVDLPKVENKEIDDIAKKASSMESIMEEELKGLTSELKKKEGGDEEKKDDASSESESKDEP